MNILLNSESIQLPKELGTVKDLVIWKKIPSQGTAVAVNDKLIPQSQWGVTQLNDLDRITIISAAFGG